VERLGLGPESYVVELASNDGYLLRNFVERGIPCLGIEPARNVAAAARERGVPTMEEFFGTALARDLVQKGPRPDLLIGNNVLAQVPDLNDFLAGMKLFLAPGGVITLEFPHLVRLVEGNQFDTVYHEHFSYFSLLTVQEAFRRLLNLEQSQDANQVVNRLNDLYINRQRETRNQAKTTVFNYPGSAPMLSSLFGSTLENTDAVKSYDRSGDDASSPGVSPPPGGSNPGGRIIINGVPFEDVSGDSQTESP